MLLISIPNHQKNVNVLKLYIGFHFIFRKIQKIIIENYCFYLCPFIKKKPLFPKEKGPILWLLCASQCLVTQAPTLIPSTWKCRLTSRPTLLLYKKFCSKDLLSWQNPTLWVPCPKTIIPNTGLCKSLITSNKAGSVPTHILEMEFQFRKRLKGSGLGSTPLKVLLVSWTKFYVVTMF